MYVCVLVAIALSVRETAVTRSEYVIGRSLRSADVRLASTATLSACPLSLLFDATRYRLRAKLRCRDGARHKIALLMTFKRFSRFMKAYLLLHLKDRT